MKYFVFTAGRGPLECSLTVYGIQEKFVKFLKQNGIDYELHSQSKASVKKGLNTIVFKCFTDDAHLIHSWEGTIQWICPSPLRKTHKRKNWFIKAELIDLSVVQEIDFSEVVVQSFRASGPGGQHRNKVETAIRLIHKPSGLIVTATDGKSQHQNKKKAWEKLRKLVNDRSKQVDQSNEMEQWESQIEIERGNPIKVFKGMNFKEV